MSIKVIEKDVFETIRKTVNKTVNLIKPTYGPAANKVIISKITHKMVVDDGVQIARDLEFADPVENAILSVIRETAIKTNDRVGDGTTSSLIMLQAIIEEVAKLRRWDGHKVEKELKKGFEMAKAQLLKMAVPIKTEADLLKVARNAFDNPDLAKIIAETWFKIGKDGVVTVDRSGTMESSAEVTEGITMNRGYISPYMITNPNRMEAVIEKPYILVTDFRLTETADVLGIMDKLAQKQILNLVVICDNLETSALATAIVNKVQGKFNLVAINIPTNGDKANVLEDICLMVGGKVFSEKKGDRLESCEITDLGRASRFISHNKDSVIIGPKGNKVNLSKAITELKIAIGLAPSQAEKKALENRLATLTNKVAVIKIGAATENEEKALRYKTEDAVHATQAAFKGGVVSGAGLGMAALRTSSPLLNAALQQPFKQLKENTGITEHQELKQDEAINVITGKIGKYMEVGVIDPVDVLIAGIESSVSIASLLVTTSGIICEPPQQIKQQ